MPREQRHPVAVPHDAVDLGSACAERAERTERRGGDVARRRGDGQHRRRAEELAEPLREPARCVEQARPLHRVGALARDGEDEAALLVVEGARLGELEPERAARAARDEGDRRPRRGAVAFRELGELGETGRDLGVRREPDRLPAAVGLGGGERVVREHAPEALHEVLRDAEPVNELELPRRALPEEHHRARVHEAERALEDDPDHLLARLSGGELLGQPLQTLEPLEPDPVGIAPQLLEERRHRRTVPHGGIAE